MRRINGGVCAPLGFSAGAAAGGIKYKDRDDTAIIVSESPCTLAGTFTSNVVKAAPVIWDRELVKKNKKVRAVVINSGIANAATGEEGLILCRKSAVSAMSILGLPDENVVLGSTGVIGAQLPIDRLSNGIKGAKEVMSRSAESADRAANAILTTDTHKKEIALTFELGKKTVTMGAMAKGAGMIHPNMCTMLAFITTDAKISHEMLQKALSDCVGTSFNMISVDGDMSTNDSCLVIANGKAGNKKIVEADDDFKTFEKALQIITLFLAKSIAEDGEGATELLECRVKKAKSKKDAVALSKSVIESNLTKAAVYGHDANWGRIICALGYSGVKFDPYQTDISVRTGITLDDEVEEEIKAISKDKRKNLRSMFFDGEGDELFLCRGGMPAEYSEEIATKILSSKHVIVTCYMNEGKADAVGYGCDLTHKYVDINADYRS